MKSQSKMIDLVKSSYLVLILALLGMFAFISAVLIAWPVTLSLLLQCFTICGCDQSPPDAGGQQSSSLPTQIATESQMHEVASKQCLFHVLKNVDRPFDAKLEPGCIYINPTDPVFAQCVMYCTHEIDGKQTRSLFFVTLDNNVYPKFAAKPDELHCVLVNRDGKVVFKDKHVDSLQGLRDAARFHSAIAKLCSANCAPHLMPADALVKYFRHRVKCQLAGLGDHHIHDTARVKSRTGSL